MTQTVRVKISGSDAPVGEALVEWFQSEFNIVTTQFQRFRDEHEVELADADHDACRIVEAAESGVVDDALHEFGEAWVQNITQGPKDEFYWNRLRLYEHVPIVKFNPVRIDSVSTADLCALTATIDLLIVTTTPIEREALYDVMLPLPGHTALVEGALNHSTYRLGRFGRYCAAHVECTMSGEGRDGSPLTILDSIKELSPKAIVILGIAFGVNRVKQSLGDVIVAETVVPYELARHGTSIVPRGQPLPCGTTLSERFRTRRHDWHLLRGSEEVKVHQGLLLSGAKLIDNIAFRDSLISLFPGSIGGEMEGAGAYAAAARTSVESILIKGICDWADGHKNDKAQPFAAHSAVSLALHVLSKEDVLKATGARDIAPTKVIQSSAPESRFVGRCDELSYLEQMANRQRAILIHGLHGIGKTSLIYQFTKHIAQPGNTIHYVNFQHTSKGDGSLRDGFLPVKPSDSDLSSRIWQQLGNLEDLTSQDIVVFDEIESLLYHMGELDVIHFLRRLARLNEQRYYWGSEDQGLPLIIIIARRDWGALEWEIVKDSPALTVSKYLDKYAQI